MPIAWEIAAVMMLGGIAGGLAAGVIIWAATTTVARNGVCRERKQWLDDVKREQSAWWCFTCDSGYEVWSKRAMEAAERGEATKFCKCVLSSEANGTGTP